jgi:hypothetical protein
MTRGATWRLFLTLLILASLAGLLTWTGLTGRIAPHHLYARLLRPLLTLSLAIGVGLFLGLIIEGAGLTARLGRLAAPLLRFGHLKEPSALAFTAAFFSAASASTLLMNAHEEGRISRRELALSALILTLPAFFAHAPSLFFVITPLVGIVGVYYLAILLAADLLRTVAYLIYGRLRLPYSLLPQSLEAAPHPAWRQVWRETRAKFLTRLQKILMITIPVFVGIFLAQEGGGFDWLRLKLTLVLKGTHIPLEAMSILAFSLAAETTGGFAAAGAFLESGTLSPAAILLTLLLGTILASPMRALRHQMPYYLGVFSPGLGLKLMILSQVFRTLSLLPFVVAVWWWA